ncbi:hypothetical protein [Maritalea sp. S77]|uniref:hypothetical protein n=1 Tax=Maritalea sp. S77 TaxID=3415125 RepID=UPI003C7CF0B7
MNSLETSLSTRELAEYVAGQLNQFFPDNKPTSTIEIMPFVQRALKRLEHCFSRIDNKYFFDGKKVYFNHLHGDQYAMWLYFLSSEIFRTEQDLKLPSKIFLLNKSLHGCDIFFEVELPSVFLLVHPLGTVLGRGNYADYFVAYQRCSVGSNHDIFPTFDQHVTLRPGATVLGDCRIGHNVQVAAETLLVDRAVDAEKTVMGRPGYHVVKNNSGINPVWRHTSEI